MNSSSSKSIEPTPEELEDIKLDQLSGPSIIDKIRFESNSHRVHADTYCIAELDSYQCMFFGIYDGHGTNGFEASKAANDHILTYIEMRMNRMNELNSSKETKQFIKEAFHRAEEKMKESDIDYSYSGTCGLVAFIRKSQLYIANVGSSQAILSTRTSEGRKVEVHSRNHTLPAGSERIWLKGVGEEKIGLTTTRSLGNFELKKQEMSSEIDWKVVNLGEGDEFIVLGSDGLWNVMSLEEVANYIADQDSSRVTQINEVVNLAKKKWEERDDKQSDDITAIIIYLKPRDV